MKIWQHGYVLNSPWHGQDHPGVLLKIEFPGGEVGHADLHPWPELGDLTLTELLRMLTSQRPHPRLERTLVVAAEDATARAKKASLFTGYQMLTSHKLLPNLEKVTPAGLQSLEQQGYTLVKVKMGRDLTLETEQLKALLGASGLKWRLDFNGRLSAAQFQEWLTQVPLDLIDGIEDPVQGGQSVAASPTALFCDRISFTHSVGDVIKPEIQSWDVNAAPGRRLWLTNNLGHPFGHAVALAYAARWQRGEAGGLQGLQDYDSAPTLTAWREQIRYHGAVTLPPAGTGFGFDAQLARLPWKALL
ncbi:MAG: hypothetical protein AB7N80_14365 [Bdellovibrionales bacterium]